MHRAPLPLDYFSSLNNKIILIPSPLALAPPTTYPTHGQGQNKMKEVVQTDGYRFSSGRKGNPKQRPPGPIILLKGIEKFENIYEGWKLASNYT